MYLVFSVLRSDARALTSYLRRRAGAQLAESYEADIFQRDRQGSRAEATSRSSPKDTIFSR